MVVCLERGADLHMAQLMPLPLTVSCFSKIQIGFTFLYRLTRVVPEKGPLNGCVCVCVCTYLLTCERYFAVRVHTDRAVTRLTNGSSSGRLVCTTTTGTPRSSVASTMSPWFDVGSSSHARTSRVILNWCHAPVEPGRRWIGRRPIICRTCPITGN